MKGVRSVSAFAALMSACSLFVSTSGLDDGTSKDGGTLPDATAPTEASGMEAAPPADVAGPTDGGVDTGPPTSPYAMAVLADSPLAYWHLDETSGTIAHDAIGDAHPGNLVGGVTLGAAGAVGEAMAFDGKTGCIDVLGGSAFVFPSPQPFSIELWLRVASFDSFQFPISSETSTTGRFGWSVVVSTTAFTDIEGWNGVPDAALNGFIMGAYSQITPAPGKIPVDTWTYVVGAYDGGQVAQIWVNGVLCNRATQPGGLPDVGSLALGCSHASTPSEVLFGALDEVAVYGTVLTQSQVTAHYQASGR